MSARLGLGIGVFLIACAGQLSAAHAQATLSQAQGGSAAISLTAALDATFGSSQGAVLYRGSTAWGVLGPATAGQFLETGGAGANPSWGTPGASGITWPASGQVLVSAGTSANPVGIGSTGSGVAVLATAPSVTTLNIAGEASDQNSVLTFNPGTAGNSAINVLTGGGGSGNLYLAAPGYTRFTQNSALNLQLDPTDVTVYQTLNLSGPAVINNTWPGLLHENANVTGTSTDPGTTSINLIQVASDVAATGPPASTGAALLNLTYNFGGSGMTGTRVGLLINTSLVAPSSNAQSLGGTAFAALQVYADAAATEPGAGLGTESGTVWAFNTVTTLTGAAHHLIGSDGYELDMNWQAGSSGLDKLGLAIGLQSTDAVHGSRNDVAINIGSAGSGTWNTAYQIGNVNSNWPLNSSSTIMEAIGFGGAGAQPAANGIHWANIAFSGNSWNDGHVTISGAGVINTVGLTFTSLPAGTAASYACFTAAGALVSSATACP